MSPSSGSAHCYQSNLRERLVVWDDKTNKHKPWKCDPGRSITTLSIIDPLKPQTEETECSNSVVHARYLQITRPGNSVYAVVCISCT